MKPSAQKRNKLRTQSRNRQTFFRENQKKKGLTTLQVTITRFCNKQINEMAKEKGVNRAEIIRLAIESQQGKQPPPPKAILVGEHIGNISISEWVKPELKDDILKFGYKHNNIAINAVIHAYYKEQGYLR